MLEAVVAGIPAYAILVGCLVHLVPGWAAGPSAALGRPRLPQRQH
jgi:hypothetical protein